MPARRFKRALAVGGIAGLAMASAGCAGGSGGSAGEPGETEISLYHYQRAAVMQPIVDAFNEEHPDIKVTLSDRGTGSAGDYANVLQTRIAGNQTPDIFQIVAENRSDIVANGVALDLTGSPALDGVDPSWLDQYRDGDAVYGVTFTAWMGGIIYNKDLLAQVGHDTVPTTWDEFIELGEDLLAAGITPYYEEQALASGSLTALLASSFDGQGSPSSDWVFNGLPEGETYSEAWEPALAAWDAAIKAGVISPEAIALDADQIKSAFLNQEVAMMRSGNWHEAEIQDAGLNYGFAAFPAFEDGKTFINGGGDPAYAIAAASPPERQEAAQTFLDFLASSEGVKLLAEGQGAMSISSNYTTVPSPQFQEAYENNLLTGQKYWLEFSQGSGAMVSTLTAQQQLLIQGQITPQEFAAAMDAEWNKL